MNKVYTRINWENYPSENTAVNESNLNRMDYALDELDKRVVEHETTKANVASLNNLIDDWVIDETTGVITITKVRGEQIIFDLNLEKVPVGFSMTDDGILIMTTDDGTEFKANIGSMIPILTFNDSEQIAVAVSGEGVNKTYTFTIKTGSITEDKLQPNFLADCRLYAGNAEESANKSEEYAKQAQELVEEAEASFTELSYADYQAGNYDPTKSYAIPDYPYSNGTATGTSFDDTNAQLGADDVQGAIESVNDKVDAITAIRPSIIPTMPSVSKVASGTKTLIGYLESFPETGIYYVTTKIRWGSGSSSGRRMIGFMVNDASTPVYDIGSYQYSDTAFPSDTTAFIQTYSNIVLVTDLSSTIHAWVQQNSGSDLNVALIGFSVRKIG